MSGLVAGEMRVKEESGFWVLSKRAPTSCAWVSIGLVSVLVSVLVPGTASSTVFGWVKAGALRYPSAWKPEARTPPALVIVGRRVRLRPKSFETA